MTSPPAIRKNHAVAKFALWIVVGALATLECAAQPAVPPLTGRIVDTADVLSPSAEDEIGELLRRHEQDTGNQVALLTVPSLQGLSVEEYALSVARSWALGQEGVDNGVLFLLAIEDRRMRIEVGYGLEGDLPDATAARILRNDVRPHLRAGDYDGGAKAGVGAILSALEGSYTPSDAGEFAPPVLFSIMFTVIPSIFAFMGIFTAGFARWFMFVFLVPFFWVAGFSITGSPAGGVVFVLLYAVVYIGAGFHPRVREIRETIKSEGSARVGPLVIGGGGGFSGGGGFGGGFSGGGGSFGGGGASGGW